MRWLGSALAVLLAYANSNNSASGFIVPSPSTIITSSSNTKSNSRLSASVMAAEKVNGSTGLSTMDDGKSEIESQPVLDSIRLNVNEKARTVTSVCTSGTLCTLSSHDGIEGSPFGSFVDYVLDDNGNPVFLMNEMSMHTINIRENNKVTLFAQLGQTKVIDGGDSKKGRGSGGGSSSSSNDKGQDVSRCSMTGTIEQIDPRMAEDIDAIKMRYSIEHTYADQVMDSPKFAFYRLIPSKIYFVGGFGVLAKWVDVDEYKSADPDILAKEASSILSRLNSFEHDSDLILTAKHLLGIETEIIDIRVTSIDRLGIDIRVTSIEGRRRNKVNTDEYRIGFRIPVISVEDAKSEVLKVFQEAWEIGNNYDYGDDAGASESSTVPIIKIAADSLE